MHATHYRLAAERPILCLHYVVVAYIRITDTCLALLPPTSARYLCHHYATTFHPSSYPVYAPKSTAPPLTTPFIIINSHVHPQSYCLYFVLLLFLFIIYSYAFAIRLFNRNVVNKTIYTVTYCTLPFKYTHTSGSKFDRASVIH